MAALAEKLDTTTISDPGGVHRFRLPCAANMPTPTSNHGVCPIKDSIAMCNTLLFDIGMQLREERGGSWSLVCFDSFTGKVEPPHDAELHQAKDFLKWLLRTHVCITGLKLRSDWLMEHSQVIMDELPDKSRVKNLKVQFPLGSTTINDFAGFLPRLQQLEKLHCSIQYSTDVFLATLSRLLRSTTCLTSLVLHAFFENSLLTMEFVDALCANRSLTYLEIWHNCNTTEPPGCFRKYLMNNTISKSLHLFGDEIDREELSLEETLLLNASVSSLTIGRLCGGESTVRFLTRLFTECSSMTKVSLLTVRKKYACISEEKITRCSEALAKNETLEELELPFSLWNSQTWIAFLTFLPGNKHFKRLDISHNSARHDEAFLPVLQALAQTDTMARVSFGSLMYSPERANFMNFKAFSGITIPYELALSERVSAIQRLPELDHLTSLSLSLYEADDDLFLSLAEHIRTTKALRKLFLCTASSGSAAYSSCWMLLLESILVNTSLIILCLTNNENFVCDERLASTIKLSRYITRFNYGSITPESSPTSFLQALSEGLCDNYSLLSVHLPGLKVGAEARRSFFIIREITRRNSGLVKRAAAFDQATPLEWYTACALEQASRHPGLMIELAKKKGMIPGEVVRLIRSRLRSVQGLHDFMRVTGVVKERVTCSPPPNGCALQLDDLNNDCWLILRQYLSIEDVKCHTVCKLGNSTISRVT